MQRPTGNHEAALLLTALAGLFFSTNALAGAVSIGIECRIHVSTGFDAPCATVGQADPLSISGFTSRNPAIRDGQAFVWAEARASAGDIGVRTIVSGVPQPPGNGQTTLTSKATANAFDTLQVSSTTLAAGALADVHFGGHVDFGMNFLWPGQIQGEFSSGYGASLTWAVTAKSYNASRVLIDTGVLGAAVRYNTNDGSFFGSGTMDDTDNFLVAVGGYIELQASLVSDMALDIADVGTNRDAFLTDLRIGALNSLHTYLDSLPAISLTASTGHDYSTPVPTELPEPGTLAILIGGLAGLRLSRMRQAMPLNQIALDH